MMLMDVMQKNKTVLVVGLGYRTGLATSNFLASRDSRVIASDIKSGEELRGVIEKLDPRVTIYAGNQSPELLNEGVDMIVLSPGVPASIPLISEARRRGIPVIAEIELAYGYLQGKIIAITGTDGKSTTTSLVWHILNQIGINALIGGNIGIPLIPLVEKSGQDTVSVVELSSFQLETVEKFKPDVCAILNISPDHLDRYNGMNDYFQAKLRVAMNQTDEDFFIYNKDDSMILSGMGSVRAKGLSFSLNDETADCFYHNNYVYMKSGKKNIRALDPSRMQIMGVHNIQNAMASILMVSSILKKMDARMEPSKIEQACYSFKGLEHRMERLGEFMGRVFINDSKATTVGAVEMALRSIPGNGVLILGGKTKGDDYSRLRASIKEKTKAIVLIGESSDEFSRIFGDFPHTRAESMDDAVVQAMKMSIEGDVIILSPACASFDMFKNFEERGRVFKESFEKLKRGEISWI
jgi:UDP-N-acetylmuramoylalanine--D-glutamate ligase